MTNDNDTKNEANIQKKIKEEYFLSDNLRTLKKNK